MNIKVVCKRGRYFKPDEVYITEDEVCFKTFKCSESKKCEDCCRVIRINEQKEVFEKLLSKLTDSCFII